MNLCSRAAGITGQKALLRKRYFLFASRNDTMTRRRMLEFTTPAADHLAEDNKGISVNISSLVVLGDISGIEIQVPR